MKKIYYKFLAKFFPGYFFKLSLRKLSEEADKLFKQFLDNVIIEIYKSHIK